MRGSETLIFHLNKFILLISPLLFCLSAEQEDWRHHPIYYNTKNGVPIPLIHQEENVSTNGLIISYGRAPCFCDTWDCRCCTDLIFDAIEFKRRGCFQFGYNLKQEKIKVRLLLDDTILVEDTVSGDNPPPFCLPTHVPLSSLEMCANVSNLSFPGPGRNIQFCLDFETRHSGHTFILKFDCSRFGDNGFRTVSLDDLDSFGTTRKPLVMISGPLPIPSPSEEDFNLDFDPEFPPQNGTRQRDHFKARPPVLQIPNFAPSGPNFVQASSGGYGQLSKVVGFPQPVKDSKFETPKVSIFEQYPATTNVSSANITNFNNFTDMVSSAKLSFDSSQVDFELFDESNDTEPEVNGTQGHSKPTEQDLAASFSNTLKFFQEQVSTTEKASGDDLEVFMGNSEDFSFPDSKPADFPPIPYSPQFIESSMTESPPSPSERPTYIQKIPFKKQSHR